MNNLLLENDVLRVARPLDGQCNLLVAVIQADGNVNEVTLAMSDKEIGRTSVPDFVRRFMTPAAHVLIGQAQLQAEAEAMAGKP